MSELKKIVISCGGTGGHFFPGLSIARQFKKQGGEVMLQLSGVNSIKQAEIAKGYNIDSVVLSYMPSPSSFKKGCQFIKGAAEGYISASKSMKEFAPDAVISMGSFASFPTILAAKKCKVPIFLHDGNALVGKANRLFSRFAMIQFVAFPAINETSVKAPVVLSGMPVRPEICGDDAPKTAVLSEINRLYKWQLSASVPTIMITGGSQGARHLNQSTAHAVAKLRERGEVFQVIHLCGGKLLEECQTLYQELNCEVNLLATSANMELLYQASDVVFSRSGGSTIAELLTFGKYAVLCPYPYAAEQHQNANGEHMVSTGSAELYNDSEYTEAKAEEVLERILGKIKEYRKKGQKGRTNLHAQSAKFILKEIEKVLSFKINN